MPDICVATHHGSIQALLDDAEFRSLANRPGFLVELRLDFFSDLTEASLTDALRVFAPSTVVTFRHEAEDGRRKNISDAERVSYLQQAAAYGVKFIDIEMRTPRPGFRKNGAKLILSAHDFNSAPDLESLTNQWQRMAGEDGVDIVKIAVMPRTIFDTLPLLELLHGKDGAKLMLLAMGEAGLWTRVLAGKFGAPFTFARGENAPGTAPGQLSWRQLAELYRFHSIRPEWPVYGVIGNPIGHSLSPLMHNTGLNTLHLDGVYLPLKVEGDPARFARAFLRLGLRGLSVTIPHKESVMAACAEIDPVAKAIGAINTLAWRGSGWHGSNTDADAAADSLENALGTLQQKHVLILGAGGAARAVAFGIKARGARGSIFNRTPERALALARESGTTAVTLADLPGLKPDAIVNTTPLGMAPNTTVTPLEESLLPKDGLVFDTVYNPLRTRLLKEAEHRGCRTVEGLEMFVGQGVRQFELWTGKSAPREIMREVVLRELRQRQK